MQLRSWMVLAPAAVAFALATPRDVFAQRMVQVNLESNPQGAAVRVDVEAAAPVATTPARRVRIPAGNHTLIFARDGYLPQQMAVSVRRRGETFTATLIQAGAIYVAADVDGAQIYMDGSLIPGVTPGRINNVQPGQHIIEIRAQGLTPHRETVTVAAGSVASVNATLRPAAPAVVNGVVRVIVTNPNGPTPADLAVTFDGIPMTGSPPSNDQAPPGTHILQVSAGGFRTVRREVTVTAGQTVAMAIDLEVVQQVATGGSVRVIVPTEGASVFLDGELLAGSPAQRANVPPGTHALRVTAPGRQTVTREIQVTLGQTTALEIPDLAVVAQVGRVVVRSSTPNAHVFIDGSDRGPSPFTNEAMPVGNYEVVVRAEGFDERTEHCVLPQGGACDINLPLTRSVGRAAMHIELARPVRGTATVFIDDTPVGDVGAGRDIPNITATTHEIRVRAPGYVDYVESVTFAENEARRVMVTMRRDRRGPSGAELAARRTAMSTWSGSPLGQRDLALEVWGAYGPFPVEARFTAGILPYGDFGVDAGVGIRSMGTLWELELRSRVGYRFANGLFSIGAQGNVFAGTSFEGQNNAGAGLRAIVGLHTTSGGDEGEDSEDERASSNRAGAFAFALHVGFEFTSDQLTNYRSRNNGQMNMPRINGTYRDAMNRITPTDISNNCSADGMPCREGTLTTTPMTNNIYFLNGAQNLLRPMFGATIEVSVSRHVNLFFQFERMFFTEPNQRRIFFANFWFGDDPLTYVRLGMTYKF